ncbi:hypothetical protein, partial [Nitratireductor pacificus]|uniref:hypothetical protein n=1 Tax=Nitratireductor pacificus TaxID=1231180 RepID=UPI001AEBA78E
FRRMRYHPRKFRFGAIQRRGARQSTKGLSVKPEGTWGSGHRELHLRAPGMHIFFHLGGFATHGYLSDLVVIEEIPFGKK